MRAKLRHILAVILIFFVIFLGLHFSVKSYIVSGQSMEPSFINGERVLVDKLSYHFGSPGRGDVVILTPPDNSGQHYIKRIIGLPGEYIEIQEGRIFISNDEGDFELEESADLPGIPLSYEYEKTLIPEGHYFVLGDNRPASKDSRSIDVGPIPRENITGKVWIRYWPPSEWGLSPGYSTTLEQLEQ